MRSRILSLWLPSLPTDRLLRQARRAAGGRDGAGPALDPQRPLATFVSQKGALRLEAVCARARAAGLAPGMMLADARAMVPALQVQAAEPEADARLLADLAAWCERYTPSVAIDRSHDARCRRRALAGRHRLRPSVRRRGGAACGSSYPPAAPGPGRRSGDRRYARRRLGDRPLRRCADRAAGRRPGGAGALARGRAPPGARCRPHAGASGARADREPLSAAAPGSGRALRRGAHACGSIRRRAWSPSRSRRARRRRRIAPSWPSPSRSPRPRRWSR